jgi:hypothetical protein
LKSFILQVYIQNLVFVSSFPRGPKSRAADSSSELSGRWQARKLFRNRSALPFILRIRFRGPTLWAAFARATSALNRSPPPPPRWDSRPRPGKRGLATPRLSATPQPLPWESLSPAGWSPGGLHSMNGAHLPTVFPEGLSYGDCCVAFLAYSRKQHSSEGSLIARLVRKGTLRSDHREIGMLLAKSDLLREKQKLPVVAKVPGPRLDRLLRGCDRISNTQHPSLESIVRCGAGQLT